MDDAANTMIQNIKEKTGKSLEDWIVIVKKQNFEKHGQMIKYLKTEHDFTHGYANLVALKAREADAGSVEEKDDLVKEQYEGKEHFIPLYEKLVTGIKKFGDDVEIAPKKKYVSVRRKKQFAMLTPASKSRFEIGINLKDHPEEGPLQAINKASAMCSHKIDVNVPDEIDAKVFEYLKKAYNQAG
jgi:predicted transport protein